jgi:hypothetical protein
VLIGAAPSGGADRQCDGDDDPGEGDHRQGLRVGEGDAAVASVDDHLGARAAG